MFIKGKSIFLKRLSELSFFDSFVTIRFWAMINFRNKGEAETGIQFPEPLYIEKK